MRSALGPLAERASWGAAGAAGLIVSADLAGFFFAGGLGTAGTISLPFPLSFDGPGCAFGGDSS